MKTAVCFNEVLQHRLNQRKIKGLLRTLTSSDRYVDFGSNDYLGFSQLDELRHICIKPPLPAGATGSRLITGNSNHAEETERIIADFHHAEAALIFVSGYAANMGLISSIAEKEDLLILDEYCHASLIDGAKLSKATRLRFKHNDIADLKKKLTYQGKTKIVVIESIYSMHGHEAPLQKIVDVCQQYQALLIVDEAHATGIVGKKGEGLVASHQLENGVYARIHTFGKALGLHGAAVVGSAVLCHYLINYARSFIYTTAAPPSTYLSIQKAYALLPSAKREWLYELVDYFQIVGKKHNRMPLLKSQSPIQGVVMGDNFNAISLEKKLKENGFYSKAILSPTVPKGSERLRICLHTFNTKKEIDELLGIIKNHMS